jgi:hypothetical protein
MEVPLERMRIASVGNCSGANEILGNARLRAAGTMSEEDATTMRDAMVLAAVALNWQSCLKPPMKRQVPRHWCQKY